MSVSSRFATATAALALACGFAGCAASVAPAPGAPFAADRAARRTQIVREPALTIHGAPRIGDVPVGLAPGIQARAGSVLYAAEFNPSQTNLYALPDHKNSAPKCSIATQYVNDIGVDATGTLWVPQGGIDQVTTYSRGTCSQSSAILNEPYGQPADIAFGAGGTNYVSDIFNKNGGAGLVSVYPKGASAPASTLTDPGIEEADGIAIDRAGDVFVSTYHASTSSSTVVEFKKGKMPGRTLHLTGETEADGLTFDAHQNLIVADYHQVEIEVYAPPYSGRPVATFPVKGSPSYLKLDSSETSLYVSNSATGSVDVFAYPSGAFRYTVTNGLSQPAFVDGVAVEPTAPHA